MELATLTKIQRPEILVDSLTTEERKASSYPFCKYGCGLCAFCDKAYAVGHCSHTALISGIDQGGHQLKAHMMKEHLAIYEYPKWRLASDREISYHLEQLEERHSKRQGDWIDEATLIRFIEDITIEKLRLTKYPYQCEEFEK